MRLEKSGEFTVDASYEAAFERISDPIAVAECLPDDVRAVTPREDGRVDLTVATGVGAAVEEVRLRFWVVASDVETGRIEYLGRGLGSRTKVDLDGVVELSDTDDGVHAEWRGGVDVGGLLSSLNSGIARTVAGEKIDRTADNLRTALATRPGE